MDIKINNLKKMYGNKVVFENLNLQFNTGVYGILGPNGAGKSSFIKILTTNILEYDGEILVDNIDIKQMTKVYRSMIGYMPQQQAVYDEFTLEQYLYYIGRLKGISRWRISKEIDEIVEKVNSFIKEHEMKIFNGNYFFFNIYQCLKRLVTLDFYPEDTSAIELIPLFNTILNEDIKMQIQKDFQRIEESNKPLIEKIKDAITIAHHYGYELPIAQEKKLSKKALNNQ